MLLGWIYFDSMLATTRTAGVGAMVAAILIAESQ
jgi:hypothetical protein